MCFEGRGGAHFLVCLALEGYIDNRVCFKQKRKVFSQLCVALERWINHQMCLNRRRKGSFLKLRGTEGMPDGRDAARALCTRGRQRDGAGGAARCQDGRDGACAPAVSCARPDRRGRGDGGPLHGAGGVCGLPVARESCSTRGRPDRRRRYRHAPH
eukprot:197754-Chlamydomonas_euryale.AAC.5